MAKTKAAKRKSNTTWSGADHSTRTAKRIASLQKKQRKKQSAQHEEPPPPKQTSKRPRLSSHIPLNTYKRTHLAHDNESTISLSKLRLATSQIERQISLLKSRLENWDPDDPTNVEVLNVGREEIERRMEVDLENRRRDAAAREKARGEMMIIEAERGVNSSVGRRKANLRRKPRPGPETWKLRGAARPAWEVYDFDTRYVDPHIKAIEEHKAKTKRCVNIFHLCRGRFALDDSSIENSNDNSSNNHGSNDNSNDNNLYPPPQPHCRTYLSLLTRLGSLHLSRKNYSSARTAFLSAIELEGYHAYSITNARYQLMNMYLSTNRPAAARKLFNLLPDDCSAWIRYSAALVEYVSWKILGEDGSTRQIAEEALSRAIRGNVYVVYLLGWKEMFDKAMEYTEDVVDWGDGGTGSILEGVEYYGCGVVEEDEDECCRGLGMWLGTEGSLEWVRNFVLKVLNDGEDANGDLKHVLLSWGTKLAKEEEVYEKESNEKSSQLKEADGEKDNDKEEEMEEPDLLMYAGMFRTAMDWLQDAGEFKKSPSVDYTDHNMNVIEEKEQPINSSIQSEDGVPSASENSDSSNGSDDDSDDDR